MKFNAQNSFAFVWVFLALLLAGSNGAPGRPPNIVFVFMDDQRWDDLGYAGRPFVKTPNIDRIAREGVRDQ